VNPIFSSLPLSPELLQNLESLGYTQMTPIQAQALPSILDGKDVIAQARTGSGKTAAFGLGLISRLDLEAEGVQALVLCPTRELADQIARELRRLARCIPNIKLLTLCGGMPLWPQVASLEHPPQIIVGTPGRVLEHLAKDTLQLDALKTLVLDEADRMLDMGFGDAIRDVIKKTPKARQTLLFSATYPDDIRSISRSVQRSPVTITIEAQAEDVEIEQLFFEADPARNKIDALAALLLTHPSESAVIFCNTRIDCQDVTEQLSRRGFSVIALHGDLEQRDREEALVRFANGSYRLLVATDVAARGLDVKDLPAVINYELPSDADIYVHRIGRTGRAGSTGLALSLCSPREIGRAQVIEKALGVSLNWQPLKVESARQETPPPAKMITLCVDGGRKEKVRPGDILGALTGDAGLAGTDVGKINTFDLRTYVAINRKMADKALARLNAGQIKGRNFRVRKLV
jgi:ATP-independent RNA helicase DbpA